MTKVILNKKISSRVANGHPWIYGNEVNNVVGEPAPGTITEVYTHDNKFVGKGEGFGFNGHRKESNLKTQVSRRKYQETPGVRVLFCAILSYY